MILIGISGVSCSGKTTLLRNLQRHYGESVGTLSFDDYFIGSDLKNVDEIEDFETPDLYNFEAFYNDLKKLKNGDSITLRANSLESVNSGVKEKSLASKDVIIVEGWLLYLKTEITNLFDAKMYLDISEETLTKRRFGRTNGEKHWDSYEYIIDKIIPAYRKYVEPQKKFADLVLDGDGSEEDILNQAVSLINQVSNQ